MKWLQYLRPSDNTIRKLAVHETDVRNYRSYTPITLGHSLTLIAIAGVMLLYLPVIIMHVGKGFCRFICKRDKGSTA